MLISRTILLLLGGTASLIGVASTTALGESSKEAVILRRRRRHLSFPKGSSLQLVFCFLVAALGSENIFTIGITLGLAWEIPTNVRELIKTKSPNTIRRREARSLYPSLEGFIHRMGMDGRACVLRAICEAASNANTTDGVSFAEQLVQSIFTYPDSDEDESEDDSSNQSSIYEVPSKNPDMCFRYKESCPVSVLDITPIG